MSDRISGFFVLCAGISAFVAACSASSGDSTVGGAAGSAQAGSGASGGALGSGGTFATGGVSASSGAGGGGGFGADCGGQSEKAQPVPLDMYIMLDHSGSMILFGLDLWTPVGSALGSFVAAPEAAGIGVGIQFFALEGPGECDAATYAKPAVEIAPLPGNTQAIQQAIVANAPSVFKVYNNPDVQAVTGAVTHAREWALAHPGHTVVVVYAADGLPDDTNCTPAQPPVDDVAKAAKDGVDGTPSIPVYVIGIGNIPALNQVAQAGGTGQAFIVNTANTSADFLKAMNDIRGSAALPCEYAVAQDGVAWDKGKVNVTFTPTGGASQTILNVGSAAACGANGGWYYDDPANPTKILVCPSTCTAFTGEGGGQVDVVLGCPTAVPR